MSLVHHIEDKNSPVFIFMAENLPDLSNRSNALRQEYRQGIPDEEVISIADEYKHLASLAGGAIERRLGWACNKALDDGPHLGGVAIAGRMQHWLNMNPEIATSASSAAENIGKAVIAYATSMTERYDTDNRAKPLLRGYQQESLLLRGAFGIAQLDAAQHSNGASLTEATFLGRPITNPEDDSTVGEGLVAVLTETPEAVIDDVYDQLDLAADSDFTELVQKSTPHTTHITPTFEGSITVGGADADMIVSNQLIDIKSTRKVRELPSIELRQLVGYLLLDTPDNYKIASLGLYRTRNGHLFSIETNDFLRMAGSKEKLPTLREKFAEQVLAPLEKQRLAMQKRLARSASHRSAS